MAWEQDLIDLLPTLGIVGSKRTQLLTQEPGQGTEYETEDVLFCAGMGLVPLSLGLELYGESLRIQVVETSFFVAVMLRQWHESMRFFQDDQTSNLTPL